MNKGAKNIVKNYMQIKKNETVLIVTDKKTLEIAKAIKKEVIKITKNIHFFTLENYGKRPIKKLPKPIEIIANKADVSFYVADAISDEETSELETLRRPLRKIVLKHNGRHAGMPGINRKIMEQGVCINPKEMEELGKKLLEKLRGKTEIKVTTKAGTDFTVKVLEDRNWVLTTGRYKAGDWGNIPSGEVFTAPNEVNGKIIIDGSLGAGIQKQLRETIRKNPLTLEIKNGRVINVQCANKELKKAYQDLIKQDKNANRIGEFAFGINHEVKEIIDEMLQDEKMPGIHIAIGDPYKERTNADYESKPHCDGVILKPTVQVNNKIIMKNGKYLI